MTMNPVGRQLSAEEQRLIKEYLDNGGTITKGEDSKRSEDIDFKGGYYTRRKKKKEEGKNND